MKIYLLIVTFFISSVFFGFSLSDPYILSELDQAKTDTEVKIEVETQNMVPPVAGMIKEIEMYGGVQKYIYVGMGKKTKGIKVGLKGYIYNDPQQKEKVGKAEIVEIYSDIVKFKIIETSYKIDVKGVVVVEIDPRTYIE